jgi:hypothetical protein
MAISTFAGGTFPPLYSFFSRSGFDHFFSQCIDRCFVQLILHCAAVPFEAFQTSRATERTSERVTGQR